MRNVPWWGVLSSSAAPVLLAGGWTIATSLPPRSFDPMTDTVSALAALGAADRWVMTLTFLVVGYLRCDHGTRAQGGQRPWAADPGGRGRGRNACRGEPRASRRRFSVARDLGVGRLCRARGLAGRGVAARSLGAVLNGTSVIGSIVGTRADLIDVFALHAAGRTRVSYNTYAWSSASTPIITTTTGRTGH